MHRTTDHQDDGQRGSLMAALICIVLIGFGAFGAFLTMEFGILKAYALASLLSSLGGFLPVTLQTIVDRRPYGGAARTRPTPYGGVRRLP